MSDYDRMKAMKDETQQRVDEAVKAEREACALLVLDLDCDSESDLISANEAAAGIRARGES